MSKIFREKSLDQLSDPEQLDHLFHLTSPKAWLLLLGLFALLVIFTLWSIYGKVTTRVEGQGIILNRGQAIFDATAKGNGTVNRIMVRVQEQVKKGQLVATLVLPELSNQLEQEQSHLQEMKEHYAAFKDFSKNDIELEAHRFEVVAKNLNDAIVNAQRHMDFLQAAIKERSEVLDQGIVTRDHVAELSRDFYKTKHESEELQNRLIKARVDFNSHKETTEKKLRQELLEINVQERKIAALDLKIKNISEIRSPADGQIVEISTKIGQQVTAGERLIGIEGKAAIVDAAIYIVASQGKLVKQDMEARIVPTTVNKSEYGAILGKVVSVSDFPSTPEGMMAVLGNQKLVDEFSKNGTPVFIRVDLIEDPNTKSGFKWTTSKGPPLYVTNGTICDASIIVKEQAPITLLIPALKSLFNLGG